MTTNDDRELARQRNRVISARLRVRLATDSFAKLTQELVAAAHGPEPEKAQLSWVGVYSADVVAACAVLGAEVDRLRELERGG